MEFDKHMSKSNQDLKNRHWHNYLCHVFPEGVEDIAQVFVWKSFAKTRSLLCPSNQARLWLQLRWCMSYSEQCIYVYILYTYICILRTYKYVFNLYIYIFICMYVYGHEYIYIYTYVYIYIYICYPPPPEKSQNMKKSKIKEAIKP